MSKKAIKKSDSKSQETKNLSFETKDAVLKNTLTCDKVMSRTNEVLNDLRATKFNSLTRCDSKRKACTCADKVDRPSKSAKTDLIVLIDTSGSVSRASRSVSDAVSKATALAKKTCNSDLRLIFLGVEGTWAGTVFNQNHRKYITGIHGPGVSLAADQNHVGLKSEQGANAIEDLSKYADWREGACRAIFYISDEELDSIFPRDDFANEDTVTKAAVASANANNVTVFAHHLTYQNRAPQIIQNYKDLCDNTGGEAFFGNTATVKEYTELLSKVICSSCGKSVCKPSKLPNIEPCISVKWGDSKCDHLESSDYEVMTLTVCNCYTNVRLHNYMIGSLEVSDSAGNSVSILPNGTPSVKVHPIGGFCFGDIKPCSCVTREFVIITEGAKEGKYQLKLEGICYEVLIPNPKNRECFEFSICKD